jgi:hypothetical protein
MYDECVVEVAGGQLVRLPELSSHLTVGDKGNVHFLLYQRMLPLMCTDTGYSSPTSGCPGSARIPNQKQQVK